MKTETTIVNSFSVHLERKEGFEFLVAFDKPHHARVSIDEPAPLGSDSAPNAARYLAAAIGNCLAASLLFCLTKAKAPVTAMSADVTLEILRTAQKRLRIGKVDVVLHTNLPADDPALASCLEQFEDYCMVTQSVRQGIDVQVRVERG